MARIASIYRYPVKGLSPEPLAARDARARRHTPVRPRLGDRERPVRLRPGAPALPQDRFPDADAERAPRRADDPLRRRHIDAHRPPGWRRGRRGQLDEAAAAPSRPSSTPSRRRLRGPARFCAPPAIPPPTRRKLVPPINSPLLQRPGETGARSTLRFRGNRLCPRDARVGRVQSPSVRMWKAGSAGCSKLSIVSTAVRRP